MKGCTVSLKESLGFRAQSRAVYNTFSKWQPPPGSAQRAAFRKIGSASRVIHKRAVLDMQSNSSSAG